MEYKMALRPAMRSSEPPLRPPVVINIHPSSPLFRHIPGGSKRTQGPLASKRGRPSSGTVALPTHGGDAANQDEFGPPLYQNSLEACCKLQLLQLLENPKQATDYPTLSSNIASPILQSSAKIETPPKADYPNRNNNFLQPKFDPFFFHNWNSMTPILMYIFIAFSNFHHCHCRS
ncbi:chitobiosyldiphosphodolichol beta-mannosyltransferase [Gossypium arboreum]|uniref:Chitobiosyldiphosphodolichol beta-mannosyltransferase n=1 Tax=Gossypium arboreum TaxID=29729 RepID=A0A0B0PTS5_GOSAR|nr:chitobiosyldiphosphodolichol beta-mannosyltransferase [Gossypium arboreum]